MAATDETILAPLDAAERATLQPCSRRSPRSSRSRPAPRPARRPPPRAAPPRTSTRPRSPAPRRRALRPAPRGSSHEQHRDRAPVTIGTNRWYLSTAPIVRALVHLCVPMAAAMIVGALYNVINAGFIGSLHDTALLAAVTLGSPILGLVMAVGGVFGVGGGALDLPAARRGGARPGEGRRDQARLVVRRLGLGDRRRRARRRRAAPAGPARLAAGGGRPGRRPRRRRSSP